jgi:hypothetical protein
VLPRFDRIRRSFAERGFTTAAVMPRSIEGRPDDYRLAPSALVESPRLGWIDVGVAGPCPGPLAFVDGIQHYEVVGYDPPLPIVAAEIAAAVRIRTDGEYRTVERAGRRMLVGRRGLVEQWADGSDFAVLAVDGDEAEHPLKELERIHRAVDSARADLERHVGLRFRSRFPHWLVVDGVISDAEAWTADGRVIGVSKSHATLPFAGEELVRYLQLPAGHRTTVFEPATWRVAPVYSWGLRLWPWEGQDLLHGLVRIEVARTDEAVEHASEVSRWILAERVPLSRPDQRWDRLLYGIAGVERHLRSR